MRTNMKRVVAAALFAAAVGLGPAIPALADVADGYTPPSVHPGNVYVGEDASIAPYANTSDSKYEFNIPAGATRGTGGRAKQDASSTYVRIGVISRPCRMYVDGGTSINGPWYNQTCYASTGKSGGYAEANRVGQWRIRQNVYENGFRWARLTAWANQGASYVSGEWSPDSYGTYTAINGG